MNYKRTLREALITTSVDKGSAMPLRKNGYKAYDKRWYVNFDRATEKATSIEVEFNYELVLLFEWFIEECKAIYIDLFLVYAPLHKLGQDYLTNQMEIVYFFEDIAKRYCVHFLNYLDNLICNNKDIFYNTSHLNYLGAEKYTVELCDDLKEIFSLNE